MLDQSDAEDWELPMLPQSSDGILMSHEDALIRKSIRATADYVEKWASGAAIQTHMHEMRQEQLHLEELMLMRKFFGEQPSSMRPLSACEDSNTISNREMAKSPSSSQWSTSSTISNRSGIAATHDSKPAKNRRKPQKIAAEVNAAIDCGRDGASGSAEQDRESSFSEKAYASTGPVTTKDRKPKAKKKSKASKASAEKAVLDEVDSLPLG